MDRVFEVLIITLVSIPLGIVLGMGAVYVFNRMPAKWLCDYGEEPSPDLLDRSKKRLKDYPAKIIFSMAFVLLGIYFGTQDYVFGITAMCQLWLLLLIAIADAKYMIIPDQFVVFLTLFAFPMSLYRENVKDMIFGALLGLGVMLVVSLAGRLLLKKQTLGFGDVKLMAAIGLTAGLLGTACILVMTSLLSSAYFVIGICRKTIKPDEAKPLGPFISLSTAMYLLVAVAL